ncbi:hypothetical protein HYX01_00415 [Candidatus Woesearchaeota archaeon]|nr:hypothetical protein [Candidatus Woesearchaeota archaeon]
MANRLIENKVFVYMLLSIFAVFFIMFIIRPSIIGYIAYQQVKNTNYSLQDYGYNIQELKSKLAVSNVNLSACSDFNNKLLVNLESCSNKLSDYKSSLMALQINFTLSKNIYEDMIKSLKAEIEKRNKESNEQIKELKEKLSKIDAEKEKEVNDMKNIYDNIALNTANNLCCKARIDNPQIKYYKVENNKVICLEESGLNFSC